MKEKVKVFERGAGKPRSGHFFFSSCGRFLDYARNDKSWRAYRYDKMLKVFERGAGKARGGHFFFQVVGDFSTALEMTYMRNQKSIFKGVCKPRCYGVIARSAKRDAAIATEHETRLFI
jgi:hypothetical protein